MSCEICGKDPDSIVLLPIKQSDGRLNTFACLECSLASGHYCQTHNKSHLGFEDETSACTDCIKEIVQKEGERIAGIFAVKLDSSPNRRLVQKAVRAYLRRFDHGARHVELADLPLADMVLQTNTAQRITRSIICLSLRKKISLEQGIDEVIKNPRKVF